MGTLLSLQNVSFGYYPTDERTGEPTGEICQVLSDISMDIREGGYHVPVSYTHLTLPTKA